MSDEDKEAPADPMAKARAAKAAKALAKAEAELQAAEAGKASRANGQPVVPRKGVAAPAYQGEEVMVRITHWGHNQISTGGDHGFERWAKGAEVPMPEYGARQNFNKRWVEPLDPALAEKWVKMNQQEIRAAMAAKGRTDTMMANGVRPGEEWRSSFTAGELSFSPRDEEFRDV